MKACGVIGVLLTLLCCMVSPLRGGVHKAVLSLDPTLSSRDGVVVGAYIEFKCDVEPWTDDLVVKETYFYHKNKPVTNNLHDGVTIWGHTLILSRINKTAEGEYQCQANVAGKNTSKSNVYILVVSEPSTAKLNMKANPTIDLHLGGMYAIKPFNILIYDKVPLICDVLPNTTVVVTRRWFHNVTLEVLSDPAAGININDSRLELLHIEENDAGTYMCQVQTYQIMSDSLPIRVHVRSNSYPEGSKAVPKLKLRLGNNMKPDSIQKHDNLNLTCDYEPKTTVVRKITWYHNGSIISDWTNRRGVLYHNATTVILERVGKQASGKYACRIDTDDGAVVSPAELLIVRDYEVVSESKSNENDKLCLKKSAKMRLDLEKVFLDAHLGPLFTPNTIKEFDNVYFTCDIRPRSTKIRSLKWLNYESDISPSKDYEILHGGVLALPCIKKHLQGEYSCVAETENGPVRSNAVTIDVNNATTNVAIKDMCDTDNVTVIAELLHQPDFIYENDNLDFYCNVYPKTTRVYKIFWLHDDKQMKPYIESYVLYPRKPTDYRIFYDELSLRLHRVKKKDEGDYICVVETDRGIFRSRSATLDNVIDRDDDDERDPNNGGLQYPTVITEMQNAKGKFYENFSVAFYCNVQPNTTQIRQITWLMDDQKVSPVFYEDISFNKRTLIRDNLIQYKYSTVNYSCQVDTDRGTFKSTPVPSPKIITEKPKPLFWLPWNTGRAYAFADLGDILSLKNIHEEDDINMVCNLEPKSTAWFEILWYRDGRQIFGNESYTYMEFSDRNKTLNLYHISKNQTGFYYCRADTKHGLLYSLTFVYLDVKDPRKYE